MIRYFKSLYYHLKLSLYIGYIYYRDIDINRNEKWINTIKKSIEDCGPIITKCVQWGLPRYETIHSKTRLTESFCSFYNDCREHTIETSQYIYKREYNRELLNDYEIVRILGSGSIGQVYLAKSKHTQKLRAIKILHPNLEYDFVVFSLIFHILLYFVDYRKYLPIRDITEILTLLKLQLDLENEYKNNQRFLELYRDNKNIRIPEIYEYTQNTCIMEYIESKPFDESISEYNRYKIINLLSVFTNNNCLHGICHGDMHRGNWGYIDYNTIVVYDYGYCFEIEKSEFELIDEIVSIDCKHEIIDCFIEYYNKQLHNKRDIDTTEFIEKYKQCKNPRLGDFLIDLFEFCIKNRIMISNTCLNGFTVFLQLIGFFNTVKLTSIENNYNRHLTNILSLCRSNKICGRLVEYTEKRIEKDKCCEMNRDFSDFESLKKYM